ncbi:hypothetical protein [Belnapia moabensis]|uniref:hypothetical protein n=1 Tax=Belnapia moabensis TaxID=365533 RepID=UPI0005BA3FF0|nr:hypothetical protein [Belnapia moabensis]
MRLLGRLLLLLLVLPPLAWGALAAWQGARTWVGGDLATLTRLGTAQTTLAYVLDNERWTRFPLVGPQAAVRLVSHADVSAEWRDDAEAEFRYAYAVQVVDSLGGLLRETVLHQRTGIAALRDPASGEAFTTTAYADAEEIPTTASALVLAIEDLPRAAAALRLRLVSAVPDISRVAIRVYQRTPVNDRRVAVQWDRLTAEQRIRLAEGNAYPAALLTEAERTNLLRRQWKPIGPSGIAGRDYRSRSLFLLQDLGGEPIDPPALPPGLFLDTRHNGTLRLPEAGAALTLRVEPVAPSSASSGTLRLAWYGTSLAQREARELPWSAAQPDLRVELGGGLLELASDQPVAVRAFLPDGTELTQEIPQLRAFVAGPEASITFPVLHLQGQGPTPLRVDLRCLCFDAMPARGGAAGTAAALPAAALLAGPGAAPVLRYELLSADGAVLRRDEMPVPLEPSPYDRLLGQDRLALSEPAKLHFVVPREAVALRLAASVPVLLNGYNRPPDLPWRVMIPEDRFAPEDPLGTRPAWFGMRPAEWDALLAANRSVLLATQPRPPEDDPELLAGRYDWEQFMPGGNWLAREVLAPREATPLRRLSLGAVFSPLPEDGEVAMELVPATPGGPVTPVLLFLRDAPGPATLRLEVDGRPHLTTQAAAARGTLPLPPIPAGTRRIRAFAPPGTALYLSQVTPLPGALISRRAIRLPAGETVFDYEKRAPVGAERPELVVAHFYAQPAPGSAARQEVAISIEGGPPRDLGPHAHFTLRERLYDVRRGPEPPDVRVLGVAAGPAGPERALFLPFGPDLPPGLYRIRIRLSEGPEALLSLTRTTPGLIERRDIRREQIPGANALAR